MSSQTATIATYHDGGACAATIVAPRRAGGFASAHAVVAGRDPGHGSQALRLRTGDVLRPRPGTHWKTEDRRAARIERKARSPSASGYAYKRYSRRLPLAPLTNVWDDTYQRRSRAKRLRRSDQLQRWSSAALLMTTTPAISSSTRHAAPGRRRLRPRARAPMDHLRHVACRDQRCATAVAVDGVRALTGRGTASVSGGFRLRRLSTRVTLKSLAYDLEPEKVELVDHPRSTRTPSASAAPSRSCPSAATRSRTGRATSSASRASARRRSSRTTSRSSAASTARTPRSGRDGLVHAVAETEKEKIAISVGPLSGRVTGEADQRRSPGRARLGHPRGPRARLGVRGERRRGEVAAREARQGQGRADHDPARHTCRGTQGDAAGDALLAARAAGHRGRRSRRTARTEQVRRHAQRRGALRPKRRATEYKAADSGYISAWYLDEDYDGDCFVDCQMFFDFKKAPNLKAALGPRSTPRSSSSSSTPSRSRSAATSASQ